MRLRSMKPEDVNAVVRLHVSAFPGFFLTLLGARFLRVFYERFPADTSAIAIVAVDETEHVLGFVVGASNPSGFYRRILKRYWIRFALAAAPTVARRPSIAGRVAQALRHPGANPAGDRVAGLFSIAVGPDSQGRSVGRILLSEFLSSARARGCTAVQLTTDANANERTNAFYRAGGFEILRSFRTREGRAMHEYQLTWPTA
jgi:ribosomal protein S18 acetylase RimI-like enzyme